MSAKVRLGDREVNTIGYGCMGLSQAYEPCEESQGITALNAVLDMGYDHLDTAALYGFGHNEELLNKAIGHRRNEYFLASKCGLFRDRSGKREINGRPEVLKKTCEDSLRRLGTDCIDLHYLHRIDLNIPIEESLGAFTELRDEGKIRYIGISEPSLETLERASAFCEVAAVQSELSLWTRSPNDLIAKRCQEKGITFVAYSPLGRGFLGGNIVDMEVLGQSDIRHTMPRFKGDSFEQNLGRIGELGVLAASLNVTAAQLALAWVVAQGPNVMAIPGTRFANRAKDNLAVSEILFDASVIDEAGMILNPDNILGERWGDKIMREVDSEQYRYV